MGSQTKGLLARWYLRISRLLPKMCLEYKLGSTNVVADSLSGAPVENNKSIAVLQVAEEAPSFYLRKLLN